uniref:Uncharacterized protein n=1 Tax=Anguilla anguilla TaxID=7936 RepID=A0A0E9VBC9_ANGAN
MHCLSSPAAFPPLLLIIPSPLFKYK